MSAWRDALHGRLSEDRRRQLARFVPAVVLPRLVDDASRLFPARIGRRWGATVMQLGANDGINGDPLNWYLENWRWRAILVEPIPHTFERLQDTYRGNLNVRLVNAAVASESGTIDLYALRPGPDAHENASLVSSFSRAHVERHARQFGMPDELIEKIIVPAMTLPELVEKEGQGLYRLDLLHVDVEGLDSEVLRQIDPDAYWKPRHILYEHRHLPDRAEVAEMLRDMGYRLTSTKYDTFAQLRADALPDPSSAWPAEDRRGAWTGV